MLLNIRWGSLRAKIIAWFFVPSALILFATAFLAYLTTPVSAYRGWLVLLLLAGLVIPASIVAVGLKRIARPIDELTRAAQEVARGNFDAVVVAETGDEIEELAEQFNDMANQLRIAYQVLETRVAERTQELATLNAIASVAGRSLNLDEILDAALRETLERLKVDAGAILLLDGEVLRLRAQSGFSSAVAQEIQTVGRYDGICGRSIDQGETVTVQIQDYLSNAPEHLAGAMLREGVQTLIGVPVYHKGEAIGALVLASREKRQLSSQEKELLMSVGTPLGMAIENARLYEQARQEIERRTHVEEALRHANDESERRNRELTLLNRVISAMISDMSPQAVLEVVCRELVTVFGIAQAAATLLDADGDSLTVVAECKSETGPSAMGVVIPVSNNPATLYVLKQKSALAMTDAQNDVLLAPVREIMRYRGVVSLLLVPIIVNGEVIGTVGLDSTQIHEFTPYEISLAERVTAAAAQVLERERAGL